jgi:hypothetical protein
MGVNVEETASLRLSCQPSPVQIRMDQETGGCGTFQLCE